MDGASQSSFCYCSSSRRRPASSSSAHEGAKTCRHFRARSSFRGGPKGRTRNPVFAIARHPGEGRDPVARSMKERKRTSVLARHSAKTAIHRQELRGRNPVATPCLHLPILGTNLPNMGMRSKRAPAKQHRGIREAPARYTTEIERRPHSLADALFTATQQRVLGALYGQPQRSFTVSELIASTAAGSGAVQRELATLVASGLLTMRPIGNQKHYQANPAAPIHGELVGIIQKTVG